MPTSVRGILTLLMLSLPGLGRAAEVEPLGAPVDSLSVGVGGTFIPMPHLNWERYLSSRDALVVDVGVMPLLFINTGRLGVGYRRYLTGGPRGGLHVGGQADGNVVLTGREGLFDYLGANATVGGKVISADGSVTVDLRVGAGGYTSVGDAGFNVPVTLLPVAMLSFGSTNRR